VCVSGWRGHDCCAFLFNKQMQLVCILDCSWNSAGRRAEPETVLAGFQIIQPAPQGPIIRTEYPRFRRAVISRFGALRLVDRLRALHPDTHQQCGFPTVRANSLTEDPVPVLFCSVL
jgi:hypothetical protein